MRTLAAVLALALLAPPLVADTGGDSKVLLDVDGGLLVGTGLVGVGEIDDGEPIPESGLPPVSHVSHPFQIPTCPHFLLVTVTWERAQPLPQQGPGASVLQAEIQSPDGTVHEAWFDDDGEIEAATEDTLAPGAYRLDLFHLAGPPIRYDATVEGFEGADCPDGGGQATDLPAPPVAAP